MAVENRNVGFSVNGRRFCGIRRLGFSDGGAFIIDAWTTPAPAPRGSYFTALAISPPEYRKQKPTMARFSVKSPRRLVVFDDWGGATTIVAPPDIIAALQAECALNGLPAADGPKAPEGPQAVKSEQP